MRNKIFLQLLIVFCLASAFLFVKTETCYAWLDGYSYRKTITVQPDNIDSDLTGFPLHVYINGDTDVGAGMQATTTYYDIRFTDSEDNILPYEQENMAISGGSATGTYWVKSNLDDALGATLYMYYGKAGDTDGNNSSAVWDDNYVGVWHLSQGDSTAANFYLDSAGSNHGTLVDADGDTAQTNGKLGKALDFNGDADYITILDNDTLDLSTQFLEAWIYPENAISQNSVIQKGFDASENYEMFLISSAGDEFTTYPILFNTGRTGVDTNHSPGMVVNTWYQVIHLYDGSTMSTYVNGTAQDQTLAITATPVTNVRPLIIGAEEQNASTMWRFFNGIIDEVRISNSAAARPAAWVKFQYANMGGQADNELTFGSQTDNTPPTVTFSPLNGATDIATSSNITVTFNEAVRNLDDSALTDANVDSLITLKATDASGADISFDATIDGDKKVITINPTRDFSSEQVVYVAIGATVEDSSNNAITASSATFTIADVQNPTVISLSPVNGITDVALDANLVITFNEDVATSTGNAVIYKVADDSVVETIDIAGAQVSASDATALTINPTANFDYETGYYVTVANTAVDDTSGNSFAGITASTTWSFTTLNTPTCSTIAHAATYNSYPTCGVATCNAGYNLSNGVCNASGGGNGPIWIYPRAATVVGTSVATALDFSINNNATIASSPILSIGMNANPQTVKYFVLSLDPTFAKDGLVPYASSATFTLPNVPGNYTLYLKYFSPTGNHSPVISHSIQYAPSSICIPYKFNFTRELGFGMTGDDVKELQKYLNDHGSQLANQGAGSPGNETIYFVNRTLFALTRFQNNNNLKPTGKLDADTMAFIKCSGKTKIDMPTPVFTFTRDLQFGMIGTDVKELQKYLNNHDFKLAEQGAGALGFETNYFGPLTQKALTGYQKTNNIIPANGYFGLITRNFINNK